MSKNGGGPAFPVPNDANVNDQEGMSLRDWFAGQALCGILSGAEYENVKIAADKRNLERSEVLAALALHIADSMLKAREEVKP